MNTDNLPPAANLAELIRQEHERAELGRLESGMEGCGCQHCQEFYKTIDMTRYGSRVHKFGDIVLVFENKRTVPTDLSATVPSQDRARSVTKCQAVASHSLTPFRNVEAALCYKPKSRLGHPEIPTDQ